MAVTVCLCMIVRNEAPMIDRLFRSLRHFVTSYHVVDTGSVDGTPAVIEGYGELYGIPGTVRRCVGDNELLARNNALKGACQESDAEFLLFADANMAAHFPRANALGRLCEIMRASPIINVDVLGDRNKSSRARLVQRALLHEMEYAGTPPVLRSLVLPATAPRTVFHLAQANRFSDDGAWRSLYRQGVSLNSTCHLVEATDLLPHLTAAWERLIRCYRLKGAHGAAIAFYAMALDHNPFGSAELVLEYLLAAEHCEVQARSPAKDVTVAMNAGPCRQVTTDAIWSRLKFFETHLMDRAPPPSDAVPPKIRWCTVLTLASASPLQFAGVRRTYTMSAAPRLFSHFAPGKSVAVRRPASNDVWALAAIVAPDDCCYYVLLTFGCSATTVSYSDPFTFLRQDVCHPIRIAVDWQGMVEVVTGEPTNACIGLDAADLLCNQSEMMLETTETV